MSFWITWNASASALKYSTTASSNAASPGSCACTSRATTLPTVSCSLYCSFICITGNSSLEPLLEGPFAQIHVNVSWRVFGRNRTRDLQITKFLKCRALHHWAKVCLRSAYTAHLPGTSPLPAPSPPLPIPFRSPQRQYMVSNLKMDLVRTGC